MIAALLTPPPVPISDDASGSLGGGAAAPTAVALDVDCEGQSGWTPLCLAARSGNVVAATALLAKGADCKKVTAGGKSALDLARINKRTAILTLFGE